MRTGKEVEWTQVNFASYSLKDYYDDIPIIRIVSKNYLMNATSEDSDTDIADFVLKYDYILSHRGLEWELNKFNLKISYLFFIF